MKLFRHSMTRPGFTLIELVVSLGIFSIILGLTAAVLTRAFAADRRATVEQTVYDEGRIALERIAKEIRSGTIDYEEYNNWYNCLGGTCGGSPSNDTHYGKNYGYYARAFYVPLRASPGAKQRSDENKGINGATAPLGNATSNIRCTAVPVASLDNSGHTQCELYLISSDGTEKTIIRAEPFTSVGSTQYRLTMLKLKGFDYGTDGAAGTNDVDKTEGDGQIDTFLPTPDFGSGFIPIQPDTITISSLRFIITPLEDPRKNFADIIHGNDVFIQPQITIQMTLQPAKKMLSGIGMQAIPSITLQTTLSARAQSEIPSIR